jgi:hypothetical protein
MPPKAAQPLLTIPAAQLVQTASPVEWLVEGLLLKSGAAILGGAPKTGKTFLALDLCVAVASGTTGAGYFRVETACPATLLCAEDPSPVLAQRLTALARSRSKDLHQLPIEIIVEPRVQLPAALPRLAAVIAGGPRRCLPVSGRRSERAGLYGFARVVLPVGSSGFRVDGWL